MAGRPLPLRRAAREQLEFFGDDAERDALSTGRRERMELRRARIEIDFSLFRAAAELLYAGPWVAERYAAIRCFVEPHADAMNPVVRGIIEGARRNPAADAFAPSTVSASCERAADAQWENIDVLLLPTAGTIYTHERSQADPVQLNTNLGYYTNFVNLLDWPRWRYRRVRPTDCRSACR